MKSKTNFSNFDTRPNAVYNSEATQFLVFLVIKRIFFSCQLQSNNLSITHGLKNTRQLKCQDKSSKNPKKLQNTKNPKKVKTPSVSEETPIFSTSI